MNTIKKITAMSIIGLLALGTTASAHSGAEDTSIETIVSSNQELDSFQLSQNVDTSQNDILAPQDIEQIVSPKAKLGKNKLWMIAIPAVMAILATGGIAAAPIFTGAISAEAAMGLALAAAVL